MRRNPTAFHDRTFDVVVVGGGITGACLAHDATLRGLSVALIDRRDFGSATSSASSKLLHGGIRYLQQARFDKVRESARERACFLRIAPHLSRWVPFLVPTHPGMLRGRRLLGIGIECYEWLTRGVDRTVTDLAKRVPPSRFYPRSELLHLVPRLAGRDDVTGAQMVHELHLHSSERMTLSFLKSAVRGGAVIANYMNVDGLVKAGGRLEGVSVVDELGGERFDIRARVVANATGPWITGLNERLRSGHLRRPISGFSRGAHIVTRQLVDNFALALPTERRSGTMLDRGGRHVFVIPWRGCSLIGTTDRPYTEPLDDVGPTENDVADLLSDVRAVLPGIGLDRSDVFHAFAGLYPLTTRDIRPDVYQGTGDYQIIDHGREGGYDGIVSVFGAKYTTARQVAERATTVICDRLRRGAVPCQTGGTPLVGGAIPDLDRFTSDAVARHAETLGHDTVEHLVRHYGTEVDAVIAAGQTEKTDTALLEPLSGARESIGAEVRFAVEEEMAVTLSDVVFRRTGLGTVGDPGQDCLRRCAEIMGTCLGWNEVRANDETKRTQARFEVRES